MARFKNYDWSLQHAEGDPRAAATHDGVKEALLMDLRDELQALNRWFSGLPCVITTLKHILRQIKLQRRCPVHPRYTGANPPRVNCRACRRFYRAVWK